MITTVEQLIEKIEISPNVRDGLPARYEKIQERGLDGVRELNLLLNYICPNLKKVERKPNPAILNKSTGGGTPKDQERYNEQWNKYIYENSQGQFPYTEYSYAMLLGYIAQLREGSKNG